MPDGLVISRAFDATPWLVAFGSLASTVSPHGRYLAKKDGAWKAVSADEFAAQSRVSGLPERGVLELLAQRLSIAAVWTTGLEEHAEIPVLPVFLQDGRASTMFRAVDEAVPGLGYSALLELATKYPSRFIFLSQVPDAAKSNVRLVAFVHNLLADCPNIFQSPLAACVVHTTHRIMVTAVNLETLIGDLHACAVVHRSVKQHNECIGGLRALLDSDDFEFDETQMPDPRWRAHLQQILDFTLCKDVRGRVDELGAAATLRKASGWVANATKYYPLPLSRPLTDERFLAAVFTWWL
jgi:hypothetical protein